MDSSSLKNIPKKIVPRNYLDIALDANRSKTKLFNQLLEKVIKKLSFSYLKKSFQRKLPEESFPDSWIEELLSYFSSLDSNNFPKKCGVGEREARLVCSKFFCISQI